MAPLSELVVEGPLLPLASEHDLRWKDRRVGRVAQYGPAFVASIAYIDPGNFVTNIEGGARYGYLLLWCVLGASLLAMPIQYLSAKLGIVTGNSLPELCRLHLPRSLSRSLWVQAEAVAMCTDIAEFVGAAVGLNLLFDVPLPAAGVITGIIAFVVLRLQADGSRCFEVAVVAALGLISAGFVYETLKVGPSARASFEGFIPHLAGRSSVMLAAGIVGATIMPHAIYLHSALTRDRAGGAAPTARRRMLAFQRHDVIVALGAAGLINMVMLAVAARLFHSTPWSALTSLGAADRGFARLAGGGAALMLAVTLFVSGAASSAVGTYAGQTVMSGFTGRTIPLLLRRALTMAPALLLLLTGFSPTRALLLSQVILSFGIPFALVPLVWFSAKRSVMGECASSTGLTVLVAAIAVMITALDGLVVCQQIS